MEDALAVVGHWIGLVKAAKFSLSAVNRDCQERVAAGTVVVEEEFRQDLDAVFEALGSLLVHLEGQEEALEEEMDDE